MHKTLVAMLLATVFVAHCPAAAADDLQRRFAHPPPEARPWVYWFWINGNITRQAITADLEAMARVGLGGVLVFQVALGEPAGPVEVGSPEWRELLRFMLHEAQRLGLKVNLNSGMGWCGTGGPWIGPELAMQRLTTSQRVVQGPQSFHEALPQPPTVGDFCRDVAVLAFPTPAGDDLQLADLRPTASASLRGPKLKPDCLLDGDPQTTLDLPLPAPEHPQWIQIELPQALGVRQVTVRFQGNLLLSVRGELQVSDDGREFRRVQEFTAHPPSLVLNVPQTTARWFRVLFTECARSARDRLSVAEFELGQSYRIENLAAKARFLPRGGPAAQAQWPELSAGLAIDRQRIVELTAKLGPDGRLAWDVPEGKWTILRIGHTLTGQRSHPAPASGAGLECDKLSREAARAAFDGLLGPILAQDPGMAGTTLVSTHVDSWEAGPQNWTPRMRQEFQRLRGYDPLPLLPVVTGRVVESLEVSERFLWDLRQTISELVRENYAAELRRVAAEHGMRLSIEGYLGPTAEVAYGGQADEPMAEFWWSEEGSIGVAYSCQEMTSAAHVYGRPIIGAEAFTAADRERWQAHPARLKGLGDWAFCQGINRLVFSFATLQAWPDRRPGMTMGPFGIHYDRTQTWWEQSGPWHAYVARCQAVLQQGLFVADLCCLEPEGVHRFQPPPAVQAAARAGYNFDACPPQALLERVTVRDGRLELPDGMTYRVLLLPEVETMSPPLLRKVQELAEAGATILGPPAPPVKAPGLCDYPRCDDEVRELGRKLWASGRIKTDTTPAEVLAGMGLPPDFRSRGAAAGEGRAAAAPALTFIHRKIGTSDVYFVANRGPEAREEVGSFRVPGRRPELWDPQTGQIDRAVPCEPAEGCVRVPLRLGPQDSAFVVFRDEPVAAEPVAAGPTKPPATVGEWSPRETLSGPWSVSFDPRWGGPAEAVSLASLTDWTERPEPGIKYYSGPATYRTTFIKGVGSLCSERPSSREKTPDPFIILDLGRVEVVAEVKLNGRDLGVLWRAPFRVDVSQALQPGENVLEVRVTNLWVNRMIGDEQLPDDSPRTAAGPFKGLKLKQWPQWLVDGQPSPTGRYTFTSCRLWNKDEPLLPSGLLGPVRLMSPKETIR